MAGAALEGELAEGPDVSLCDAAERSSDRLYEDATARVSAFDAQLTSRLSSAEVALLQDALERCIDALEEGIPDGPVDAPDEDAEVLGTSES